MNLTIRKPTLLLDEQKCRQNIVRMCEKARRSGVVFRPHFKTHQSQAIARWFREQGTDRITVSSVTMAKYFAADDWNDITIAFPVNLAEMRAIDRLASRIRLNLLVESEAAIGALDRGLHHQSGVYIKIDSGYKRTGIRFDDFYGIEKLAAAIFRSQHLEFMGFLTHAGQTYQAKSTDEIRQIHHAVVERMGLLKKRFERRYPRLAISVGDTPACSIVEEFGGVDEIRPGNFVFYDLMQLFLGSCSDQQIAVAMACPVVALHPERNEMVIYGGAVHFSKERIILPAVGTIYGQVVPDEPQGWGDPVDGMYLTALSQEHGIITLPGHFKNPYKVGDIVTILPVHSCLTASCMKKYTTLSGQILTRLH